MSKTKYLIVIAGPTAVGKTTLSIDLAKKYQSEIISADSRQFFNEMNIGTAKPNQLELSQVKHHFINCLSIHDAYNAGKFAKDADTLIQKLFLTNNILFVVGGSGLYIKALCDGLDEMPAVKTAIRESLNKQFNKEGLEKLLIELEEADPEHFGKVDKQNPQRIIRALEIIRSTKKTYSSFRSGNKKAEKEYKIIKIGLDDDKEILYERINNRMDKMIRNGLFKEAESFYPLKHLPALQTVGYSEIFHYLDGEYDKEEAIRLLKRNSRRYAKRQLTWFKKDKEFKWFQVGDLDAISGYINGILDKT